MISPHQLLELRAARAQFGACWISTSRFFQPAPLVLLSDQFYEHMSTLSFLELLHFRWAGWRFDSMCGPPLEIGTMWSK